MRVLFISYPMAFHTPGGGEIQLMNYKKSLEKKGVEVTLFDPWAPNFKDHDLVHFFSCIGGSEPICEFVNSLGLPLIVTSSLWITEATKNNYDIESIKGQLRWAHKILTNSKMESEALSRTLEIDRAKFIHVYNAASEVFFSSPKSNKFVDTFSIRKPYILNVANIEERKNQLNLIKAMENFPDYELVIIGNVRESNYYERCKIEQNSQVKFIGPLEPDSEILVSAYQNAASFALPSTLETPGISALEAAACGIPIVVTKEGSTREYFEGTGAQFVDFNAVRSIAHGIQKSFDAGGVSAGQAIKNWDGVVSDLIKVYEGLI